jgi:hypothetical protein
VRQCVAVPAAGCGSAHGGMCLLVIPDYIICVQLHLVEFELSDDV